jgi:predicted permease
VRQLVTESLTLTAIGGAAALVVAYIAHGALVDMIVNTDQRFALDFRLEPRVLLFTLAVTTIAGLVVGLLPAWQATRSDAAAALKDQSRGTVGTRRQLRVGRLLVSLQLALSLPLLVGAGLMVRTVYNLQNTNLGYRADRLLLLRVDLQEASRDPSRHDRLVRDLHSELQRIPGVRTVSFSQLGIFTGGESGMGIQVEGYTPKSDRDKESGVDTVGPGYFTALGAPMLQGRDILDSDSGQSPAVCVINEAFARQFFESRNPMGMRISSDENTHCRVVGVAGNARTQSLRDDVKVRFFVPAFQRAPLASPTFLIRADTELPRVAQAARAAVQRVDPHLPILSSRSLDERMLPLTARDRMTAQLAIAFGLTALALAAIGLYGVLSHGTTRRSGEIAIRIALGAQPARVVAMILRETAGLVAVGLVLGGALTYVGSQMIASQLYNVAPQDRSTSAVATVLLLLVAFAATYVPARRASRVNPMVGLHLG